MKLLNISFEIISGKMVDGNRIEIENGEIKEYKEEVVDVDKSEYLDEYSECFEMKLDDVKNNVEYDYYKYLLSKIKDRKDINLNLFNECNVGGYNGIWKDDVWVDMYVFIFEMM